MVDILSSGSGLHSNDVDKSCFIALVFAYVWMGDERLMSGLLGMIERRNQIPLFESTSDLLL
jgi:hypothetical protein